MNNLHPMPRSALITGSAKRIGKHIAIYLAERQFNIALHYNSSPIEAKKTADIIAKKGVKYCLIKADLTKTEEVETIIDKAMDKLQQPIGCLINNASVFILDNISDANQKTWQNNIDVNLKAPLFLIKKFSSALPKKYHGNIINIIDQRVWNLTPFYTTYTLSKYGLWALTRTTAISMAPRIKVNAIGPGPIMSSLYQSEESFLRQQKHTPLKIGGLVEDVCKTIEFFLNTKSITGQMIAVDGGEHLGWNTREIKM